MTLRSIVYVLSQYPAANHSYLLREVTELRKIGWNVRVISLRPPDRPLAQLSPDEAREARVTTVLLERGAGGVLAGAMRRALAHPLRSAATLWKALRTAPSLSRMPRSVWYALEAIALAGIIGDDEAHVHGHFVGQVLVLLDTARGSNWSATLHGPEEFDGANAYRVRRIVRDARFVRTISSFGRAMCILRSSADASDRIHVVRLGITPRGPLTVHGTADTTAAATASALSLLSVGRLAPVKAHRALVRAVALLRRSGVPVTLRIIGDGEERPALEALIRSLDLEAVVSLLGWQSGEFVERAMRESGAFVLPSYGEGIPLVLMEAMASGCTCIATAVGGVPELIKDGVNGLLIPAADDVALEDAIRRLAQQPALREQLAAAAALTVAEQYDITRNVRALSDLFEARALSATAGAAAVRSHAPMHASV